MTVEEKYPLLIGHSLAGRTRLHNIQEVANFICTHGQYGDLVITERDGTPFLNTFGIYIDKISDMEYREKLLKVLIPMQMEIDGTNDIDKTNETEEQNMNKFEAERPAHASCFCRWAMIPAPSSRTQEVRSQLSMIWGRCTVILITADSLASSPARTVSAGSPIRNLQKKRTVRKDN